MSRSTTCQHIKESGENCRLKAGPSGYCHLHDPEKLRQREEEERLAKEETERWRELRLQQLEQISQSITALRSHNSNYQRLQLQRDRLVSVVDGLYVEIDKLTKKAPAEPVTDLALNHINDVVRDAKELLQDDPYIQKLVEFVPAGDNPELRDALIVIAQIRQGLKRPLPKGQNVDEKLILAQRIKDVLEQSIQTGRDVKYREHWSGFPSEWLDKNGNQASFHFEHLDSINLPEYFQL